MTDPTPDLESIRKRHEAALPQRIIEEAITLADAWDVTRGIFGKTRHMLSERGNDENVVLMIEMKPPGFGYWHCSPPGFDDCDYAHGTVAFADHGGDADVVLAQCKTLAWGAWLTWLSSDRGTVIEPDAAAVSALVEAVPGIIAALATAKDEERAAFSAYARQRAAEWQSVGALYVADVVREYGEFVEAGRHRGEA